MHCNITQATTVKGWVWVLRHTTPLTHTNLFCYLRGGGLPGAGTYVAPSFNHAGCVITTSGVFSFLFFLSIHCSVWLLAGCHCGRGNWDEKKSTMEVTSVH
jgi:hypothetical protein